MIQIKPNISYQQPYSPEVWPPLSIIFISGAECSRTHRGEALCIAVTEDLEYQKTRRDESKAQSRDAALQMHRPAQQVMNEPNVIFHPKWALMISVEKKKRIKSVYDSIWATWQQWECSQGLVTFTTGIMFSHTARLHSRIHQLQHKTNEYSQGLK